VCGTLYHISSALTSLNSPYTVVGLASITFKKKNKINVMVEEAIDMPGGLLEGTSWSLSKGVETALLYITNAARDIEVFYSIYRNSWHHFYRMLSSL
jgi:hypothetical protein